MILATDPNVPSWNNALKHLRADEKEFAALKPSRDLAMNIYAELQRRLKDSQ
jgi:hypothetical protein